MKIVHVINYFQPRLGYQETFLAKEQSRSGHEVSVVTSDRYYPFPDYDETYSALLGERICGTGKRVEEGITVFRLSTAFEFRYRVWLQGLEETLLKLQPDLVIVHGLLANAFRVAKLRENGLPCRLIVDEHLINLVRKKNVLASCYNAFKKARLKQHVRWVDRFVGVTGETCDILQQDFGIPQGKVAYIPLGADSDLFEFDERQRQKMRGQYQLKKDDVLVLYTGKLTASKGVGTLMKAFNQLNSATGVYLLLLGNGSETCRTNLMRAVDESKRNRVIFSDFVPNDQLPQYYSGSDLCAWGDTISVSMIEAMSCSRPIVGCNIPAFSERIEYENGLSYEKGDDQDLSRKLQRLIDDPALRYKMGQRGREFVEDQFSWRRISERFLEVGTG